MVLSGCGGVGEDLESIVQACPFATVEGSWTVTYDDTSECQVGGDKLFIAGTGQKPELLYGVGEATGSFDSATCTLTVKSYADWEDGYEPWADYRDLVLRFDGNSASGELEYAAWWFCGGGQPTPLHYEAAAERVAEKSPE